MDLRTPLCDQLGIEVPIFLAGMGGVAYADVCAAVSEAGGFGTLGMATNTPQGIRDEMRAVRAQTDKPFGVDLLLSPNFLVPKPKDAVVPTAPKADQLPQSHRDAIARIAASLDIELVSAPPENEVLGQWIEPGKSWAGSQIEVLIEEGIPVFASGLGTPAVFAVAGCARVPELLRARHEGRFTFLRQGGTGLDESQSGCQRHCAK